MYPQTERIVAVPSVVAAVNMIEATVTVAARQGRAIDLHGRQPCQTKRTFDAQSLRSIVLYMQTSLQTSIESQSYAVYSRARARQTARLPLHAHALPGLSHPHQI